VISRIDWVRVHIGSLISPIDDKIGWMRCNSQRSNPARTHINVVGDRNWVLINYWEKTKVECNYARSVCDWNPYSQALAYGGAVATVGIAWLRIGRVG